MSTEDSSPPPPDGTMSDADLKIIIATYACVTAGVLFLTFFANVTRFRLWHTNSFLQNLLALVENPVTYLIQNLTSFVLVAIKQYKNDLYVIWLVVLAIAYDNVITISTGSGPDSNWLISEWINLLQSIYIAYFVFKGNGENGYFYVPLVTLWALLLVKFSSRFIKQMRLERVYGYSNSRLVSDYMKVEHELTKPNENIDPTSLKGYKYLVIGETNLEARIKKPEYKADIKFPTDVVTTEMVWSSNKRILHPSIDKDNGFKDACLSFSFSKLLKRRFFDFPAAETQHAKTRKLVFDGLLKSEKNDVFSVIEMEIGFLRDFFYTRYPAVFAYGFPVTQIVVLIGMLGMSLWISERAFKIHQSDEEKYLFSSTHHHNIDYIITNTVLIIMVLMELIETLTYVLSDWTKVMLVCRHVNRQILHPYCFLDKVLALLFKAKFSQSINNTIGQFSLLDKNYAKSKKLWLNRLPKYTIGKHTLGCLNFICKCLKYVLGRPNSNWGSSPLVVAPRGTKEGKAAVVSPDIKKAILRSLKMTGGYLTYGVQSLETNNVHSHLGWTCALNSEFHTLIVWHIATGLCAIHPTLEGGDIATVQRGGIWQLFQKSKKKATEEPDHHLVASHLSQYCAYLMVFRPDMLPESPFSVKLLFRKVLIETKVFFGGASSAEDKYQKMMQYEHSGDGLIEMGVRLGKQLVQMHDDTQRWKIMADFWSEMIIFLAPHGKVREHEKRLQSGGEFITHLWALLYHAGITDQTATASNHIP